MTSSFATLIAFSVTLSSLWMLAAMSFAGELILYSLCTFNIRGLKLAELIDYTKYYS